MRPKVLGWVVALTIVWLGVGPAVAQSGFPWWKDPKVVQELTLSSDQSARIDGVFRAASPQLRKKWSELDRQEAELSRLIANDTDELLLDKQIDKVEATRATLNKARTIMLLHMVRVLTPEQRVKFKAVHEQWLRENPRPPHASSKRRSERR